VAGVCHARGANANLPAQWLVYVQVEDVEASARRAAELGGAVVDGPRGMGSLRFCVIRDPAGAVLALVGPR
jgi:predicted enzyme related to lactoylglutathione lyase